VILHKHPGAGEESGFLPVNYLEVKVRFLGGNLLISCDLYIG